MAHLTIVIPDELEEKLRERLPARKGAISDAVAEAIRRWLAETPPHPTRRAAPQTDPDQRAVRC